MQEWLIDATNDTLKRGKSSLDLNGSFVSRQERMVARPPCYKHHREGVVHVPFAHLPTT